MTYRAELDVTGRLVLVVGAGGPALAAVDGLRRAGARVRVVGEGLGAGLGDLATRGLIELRERRFDPADLTGVALVVARGGDPAAVRAAAATAGVPCDTGLADPGVAPADEGADVPARSPGGWVALVGGGPGDPGLITVRGAQLLALADVVVADRLAPLGLLSGSRAEVIDAGKTPRGPAMPQEEINALLVAEASAGRGVVRLKGGDPYVLGRGGEELDACLAAGLPVEVVPGVTSAVAVPGLAGVPVTHRGLSQAFTVVSGHVPPGDPRSGVDWAALAASGATLVLLMAVHNLEAISAALLAGGMDPATPAALIEDGAARVVSATLAGVAGRAAAERVHPPAVVVIGAVAARAGQGGAS